MNIDAERIRFIEKENESLLAKNNQLKEALNEKDEEIASLQKEINNIKRGIYKAIKTLAVFSDFDKSKDDVENMSREIQYIQRIIFNLQPDEEVECMDDFI